MIKKNQKMTLDSVKPEIESRVNEAGVVAVLVIDDEKHALTLAKALMAGGVNAIELTMRTPAAVGAATAIKKELPELLLGMGTVLTTEQAKIAAGLGADFAVAPGCNPRVIAEARLHGLSFAPGIQTATDIEMALEQGCRIMKYFPAESAGGLKHLRNISGPYAHLDPKFIPLGGLNIGNAADYLASPIVTAIGGSWLAKRDQIAAEDWAGITANAKAVSDLVKGIRS